MSTAAPAQSFDAKAILFTALDIVLKQGIAVLMALIFVWHLVTTQQYYARLEQEQHIRMTEQHAEILKNQIELAKTLERLNNRLDTLSR